MFSLYKQSSKYPLVMAQYRQYVQWCIKQGLEPLSTAIISFEDYSARIIQSWWRKIAGLQGASWEDEVIAGRGGRMMDEQTSAIVIQKAWRRFNVSDSWYPA